MNRDTFIIATVGVFFFVVMLAFAWQSDREREHWVNKCFSEGKVAAKLAVTREWTCVELKP